MTFPSPRVTCRRPPGYSTALFVGTLVLNACGGSVEPAPATVASVVVTPASNTVTAFGPSVQLSASARDASGAAISGKTFTWSPSDPLVATVSSSGLVTAVADGPTNISATTDGVTGTASVTVAQAVAAVVVTPGTVTLTALGDTVRFSGVANDANGNAVAGTSVSWSSSDTTIATVVDTTGLATSVGLGTATITGTSGTGQGTASLAVTPTIATVELTPPVGTINALGDTTRFTAVAKDPLGNPIPGAAFAWASSDTLVATVDNNGLATAIAIGSATITATADTVQAAASVTVVLSGTGTNTLLVVADIVANDLGGGAFSTDFSVTLTDAVPAPVSGATVTFTNATLGVVTLVETGPGTGIYVANQPSFPGGEFELDVVSGTDNVMDVVARGPGVHAITQPLVNDTLVAGQPMTITWTVPSQAKEAEIETRDFSVVALPDTGAFVIPGPNNPANTSQRIRVFRFNDVDIAGGLAGSRLKIKIRAEVEPVVVQ